MVRRGRPRGIQKTRKQNGQALVELASLLPLVALLLVAAVMVSQLLNSDIGLRTAAREAAFAAGMAAASGVSGPAVAATAQAMAHFGGVPANATVVVAVITGTTSGQPLEQVTIDTTRPIPFLGTRRVSVAAAAPIVALPASPTPFAILGTPTPVPTPTNVPSTKKLTDDVVQLESPCAASGCPTTAAGGTGDLVGNGMTLLPGTGFFYTFYQEATQSIGATWKAVSPPAGLYACLYMGQPFADPTLSSTTPPLVSFTDAYTTTPDGPAYYNLEGTSTLTPTTSMDDLDDAHLTCDDNNANTSHVPAPTSNNVGPGYYTAYFYNGSTSAIPVSTQPNQPAPGGAVVTYYGLALDDYVTHEQYLAGPTKVLDINIQSPPHNNAWCTYFTTAATGPITATWHLDPSKPLAAIELHLYQVTNTTDLPSTSQDCNSTSGQPFPLSAVPAGEVTPDALVPATTGATDMLTGSWVARPQRSYILLFFNGDTTNKADTWDSAHDGAVISYEH